VLLLQNLLPVPSAQTTMFFDISVSRIIPQIACSF